MSLERAELWKDVLSDMRGSWKAIKVKNYYFAKVAKRIDRYHTLRYIYQHKEATDFHRGVIVAKDCDGNIVSHVFMQFYIDSDEHHVIPTLPHGN